MRRASRSGSRRTIPVESVAISGTHDTDTLAEWWDGASREERLLCCDLPGMRDAGALPDGPYTAGLRDALLQLLFAAASDYVIVPIQDVFGWRDRVNVPAIVNEENWTWRLPWPVDELATQPEARERGAFIRALATGAGRT